MVGDLALGPHDCKSETSPPYLPLYDTHLKPRKSEPHIASKSMATRANFGPLGTSVSACPARFCDGFVVVSAEGAVRVVFSGLVAVVLLLDIGHSMQAYV